MDKEGEAEHKLSRGELRGYVVVGVAIGMALGIPLGIMGDEYVRFVYGMLTEKPAIVQPTLNKLEHVSIQIINFPREIMIERQKKP